MHLFQINHLQRFHQQKLFLKIFNSDFLYIKVWFTDQNSKPLDINDRINLAFK